MVSTNHIIEAVREHPVLYNVFHPNYRCKRLKDEEWSKIAQELNGDGNELRKKWKNIRDCFKKYLKSITPGCPVQIRSYKNWQWAESMNFIKPFILLTEPELKCKATEQNNDVDDQISENTNTSDYKNIKENQHIPEEHESFEPSNKPNQLHYSKESAANLDATDLIFLGYSNTIKTFTPTKQAIIKMKIAQIILEEELYHAEGIPFQSHFVCKPLSSNADGNLMISNSTTEVNIIDATSKAEPTKSKRAKKRKINSSAAKSLCTTSSYSMNNIEEETLEIKSETNVMLDSD